MAMAVAAASGVCDCCGREKVSAVVSVAAVNAEMEVVAVDCCSRHQLMGRRFSFVNHYIKINTIFIHHKRPYISATEIQAMKSVTVATL